MNLPNDAFMSRVEAVEASVGLPVGLWRTGVTGKEWERKVHEAASERRIQAVQSVPMRGGK